LAEVSQEEEFGVEAQEEGWDMALTQSYYHMNLSRMMQQFQRSSHSMSRK